ncbi:MAG: PEP/pyruvate-binding domain-containing protein [Candidatus Neomarinimicrobiota bacterium]
MQYRVHEILLIASNYDSYILEEDGRLTEQILTEYIGMNLSYAPRLSNVSTAEDAMKMLDQRSFDLIIVMLRISDMNPIKLSKKIKKAYPQKPIILLAFDESELNHLPKNYSKTIDNIFVWSGNSSVFPAIIKYIEDKVNVERDTQKGDVRSIIVVEDTPRYYSSILPMLYKLIVYHTKQLIDNSLDDTQKLLHLRKRPKILLAQNFEQAVSYFDMYKNNLLGIISDIRFPKENKKDSKAGIYFSEYVQSIDEGVPIILQTTESSVSSDVSHISDLLLNKNSTTLYYDLKELIIKNFGFGNFIFKRINKNSNKIEATNIEELLIGIKEVSNESLVYHASRNHFSNWLSVRGEFNLANNFRKLKTSHFDNIKDRRSYHIELLENALLNRKEKFKLVQFKKETYERSNFLRIGKGSLGGKARGLAFLNENIYKNNIINEFPTIDLKVPRTAVISTDSFDLFMDENNLWEIALNNNNNDDIINHFLKARLSKELIKSIKSFLKTISTPLAVRSSGLLEDSQYQPLAGMYSTFMLPNSSDSEKERLSQVCEAIKRIYASTFFKAPKTLLSQFVQHHEEEKMAIIIMEMTGKNHTEKFYPSFSGVAQSYNYYPVSHMKRNQGIAFVALGLGKTIAEGKKSLRFSPYYPDIISQYYSSGTLLENSQNEFYALNLNKGINPMDNGEEHNLCLYNLDIAEKDGELKYLASVLDTNDNVLRDSLLSSGPRVLTFAGLLKYNHFPLSDILKYFLEFGEKSLGCPVEIEFAVNLNEKSKDEFSLLQIKPMTINSFNRSIIDNDINNDRLFCKSNVVLGEGLINDVYHIIYVDLDKFDISQSKIIAYQIEELNKYLGPKNPYLLVGPGRWGSSDQWLGIPTTWEQINNAKIIMELGIEGLEPDPSFGSHFFQNITSLHLGYFTFNKKETYNNINWDILKNSDLEKSTDYVKLFKMKKPLKCIIDGTSGKGVIFKNS